MEANALRLEIQKKPTGHRHADRFHCSGSARVLVSVAIIEERGDCYVHQHVPLLVAAMANAALHSAVVEGGRGRKAVQRVLQLLLGWDVQPCLHQLADLCMQTLRENRMMALGASTADCKGSKPCIC